MIMLLTDTVLPVKLHSKRVEKIQKHTRNECKMSGVKDAIKKYSHLGHPTVVLKLDFDHSGILQFNSAEAVFDENVTYKATEKVKTNFFIFSLLNFSLG